MNQAVKEGLTDVWGMEREGEGRARVKVCEMERGVGRGQEVGKADTWGNPERPTRVGCSH